LLARLRAAREVGGGQAGALERLRRHHELATEAPAFSPNLLELGRCLQGAGSATGEDSFTEAEAVLRQAVEASERGPTELLEQAWFLSLVRASPQEAAPLLEEAAGKALRLLEDAWSGLIDALVEQGELKRALTVSDEARRVFPASVRIITSAQFARTRAVQEGLLPPESD
jgi:tetratricopeptide (TPR) repeat protein